MSSHDNQDGPVRVNIHLSKADLRAIDDFRFYVKIPTRSAAIRELLRRGLASSSPVELNNHR
jgi:metal-responsive CopG/Arc/MetJ family transcriptional regulator